MATQGIMASGAAGLLKSFTAKTAVSKAENKASDSQLPFDQMVRKSQTTDNPAEKTKAAVQNQNVVQDGSAKETIKTTDKQKDAKKAEETTDSLNQTELETEESEIPEKLNEFLAKLNQSICELLDITEEELEGMLEQLGMTMADLMQPQNISMLIMQHLDTTDSSVFLTDETAAKAYTDILEQVEAFKQIAGKETGLTPEELTKALEQLKQKPEELPVPESKSEEPIPVTVIKPETEETVKKDSQSFTSQKETSSNHQDTPTPGEQFLQNLTNEFVKEAVPGQKQEQVIPIREIAQQIIEQVKIVIHPAQTSMEMQLNPEHLGKVNLNITSKDGVMTAQFLTQTQVAKEAIESQIQTLRETLEQQGIKVEAIEVAVSEYAFQQNGEPDGRENQQESSKKRNFIGLDKLPEEDTTAEEPEVDLTGSSVNYMV